MPNTENPPFTVYQVVSAIIDGDLDTELESLTNAISERTKLNNIKKAAMFKIGDRVRFVDGRPKYLVGLTAIIVKKKQKNFVVQFDEGQNTGKYRGNVTCPPNLLEAI